jgi:hypothetical protein
MLKRMYIVISLLSIATIMHGMEEQVTKRSVGGVLNDTLDKMGIPKQITGTITTLEQEFGGMIHGAEKEITLLGVTSKGAYEAAVVGGALYLTAEMAKYIYTRYVGPQEQPLDATTQAVSQSAANAHSNAHILGQFVSTTQINAIVEAKWQELMTSSKLADKDYVNTATAQIRNMATSALETTASRVASLESQVKGLAIVIHGDAKTTPGIVSAHDILKNRIAALENQKQSASFAAQSKEQSGGMMDKLFGGKRRKKGADSAVHGVEDKQGDKHSQDAHDNDDDADGANITDLQAPNPNNNNNNTNNHGSDNL